MKQVMKIHRAAKDGGKQLSPAMSFITGLPNHLGPLSISVPSLAHDLQIMSSKLQRCY